MKTLLLILSLILGAPLSWAAAPSNPSYLNFYHNEFTTNNPAPGRIRLKLNSEQFDNTGDTITITNVFGPGVTNIYNTFITSNLFVTNLYTSNLFVTNLYATNIYVTNLFATNIEANVTYTTNLYVTNLYVTYEVVSNIVAGNVHGTVGTLAMFTPDEFSVGDSIVTQNTNDNNGITINGTGEGYIVFGPGTTNTLARHSTDLIYESPKSGTRVGYFGVSNTVELAEALFGVAGNLAEVRGPSGASLLDNLSGGNEIRWGFNQFFPRQTNTVLGSIGLTPRFELAAIHAFTNVVEGFYDATDTNYSRLHISHTGTNGFIVFDSQSSGTAGAPRDFKFLSTNVATAIYTENGSGTGAKISGSSGGGRALLEANGLAGAGLGVVGNSDGVIFQGNVFAPFRHNTTDLSGPASSTWFRSVGVRGTNYVAGYWENGGTNSSYLTITHTGTNGVIQFDSAAWGTAGTPVPFAFTNAPVILPYVTKAQKTALTAIDGMIVYQTDNTPGLRVYVAGTWYMIPTVADP